jgi:Flp pilus assembly protein TadG
MSLPTPRPTPLPIPCAGRRGERGTLSLELSIIAPMLLLLLFLFIAFGRFGQTTGLLEQGVRDSARSATQTRSPAEMWEAVDAVEQEVMADLPASCRDSLATTVDYDGGSSFAAGTFVTVTYSCDLSFTDLMLPGSGGGGGWADRSVTRSFTSRLDPNRGVYR